MKNLNKKFKLENLDEDIKSTFFKSFNAPDKYHDTLDKEYKYAPEDYLKMLDTDFSYTPNISFVDNRLSKTPKIVNIEDVFDAIKKGAYKEHIDKIRNTEDPTLKSDLKKELPAIMFGGTFLEDRLTPTKISRLVCVDFDRVPNLEQIIKRLKFSSFVYMFFVSPSGNGLKVIIRTNAKTAEEYKIEINRLFDFYNRIGLYADTQKQSINDLCFYSSDPNAYLNTSATIWRHIDFDRLIIEDDKIIESVEHIIDQIESLNFDITRGGEISWDLGLGIANKFGEDGRIYFQKICSKIENYNPEEYDEIYAQCLTSCEFGSINSLIWSADCANLEVLPKPVYLNNDEDQISEYEGLPLTKENILKATNGGLLFYKFVIPSLRGGERSKKNVKNPFYSDKKGSLSIYKKDDRWIFYDHGEINFHGDIFDFANYYYRKDSPKDFYQLLIDINRDLKLGLIDKGREKANPDFTFKPNPLEENSWEVYYKYSISDLELEYWKQYGISKQTLKEFKVKSVSKLVLTKPDGKTHTFFSTKVNPIFAYVYSRELIKIYRPFDKNVRFFWIGSKAGAELFGYTQCNREDHIGNHDLIITGGEKDVMSLYELEYFSVTLNSETSLIPQDFLNEIKHLYKSVIVLYDIDETGIKSSNHLVQRYNLKRVHLPEIVLRNKGKDIADYIALGGSTKDLEELIIEASEAYSRDYGLSTLNVSQDKKIDSSLNNMEDDNHEETDEEEDDEDEEPEEYNNSENEGKDGERNTKNDQSEFIDLNNSRLNPDINILEEEDKNEEFPFVSHKVIDFLPEFLKKGITLFDNERERDVFLYSSLGVISGFLPNVYGHYDGHEVFPNLYLLILAPPASNKSVAKWAKKMGEDLHLYYKEIYNEELRLYKECLNNGDTDGDSSGSRVDKPERKLIFLPSNSSATAFLQNLCLNNESGILFETEADTLGGNLGHDWGNYSDSLRKAFHHEALSYSRRANSELIEISEPKLSIVLSGTPGQLKSLISGVENGLCSRFMFYYFKETIDWKDTFKTHDKYIYNDEFKKLGIKLSTLYRKFEGLNEDVKFDFTKDQKERFRITFEGWLTDYVSLYGDSIAATTKRIGLITFRIGMILSMLRFMDKEVNLKEVQCSEDDFKTALVVAENLLEHASRVIKLLPNYDASVYKGSEIKQRFYDSLPNEFSYQESLNAADSIALKHKTAEKYRNEFIKEERLKRIEHGKYIKVICKKNL